MKNSTNKNTTDTSVDKEMPLKKRKALYKEIKDMLHTYSLGGVVAGVCTTYMSLESAPDKNIPVIDFIKSNMLYIYLSILFMCIVFAIHFYRKDISIYSEFFKKLNQSDYLRDISDEESALISTQSLFQAFAVLIFSMFVSSFIAFMILREAFAWSFADQPQTRKVWTMTKDFVLPALNPA